MLKLSPLITLKVGNCFCSLLPTSLQNLQTCCWHQVGRMFTPTVNEVSDIVFTVFNETYAKHGQLKVHSGFHNIHTLTFLFFESDSMTSLQASCRLHTAPSGAIKGLFAGFPCKHWCVNSMGFIPDCHILSCICPVLAGSYSSLKLLCVAIYPKTPCWLHYTFKGEYFHPYLVCFITLGSQLELKIKWQLAAQL